MKNKVIKARCDNCGGKLKYIDTALIRCTKCGTMWHFHDKPGWYKVFHGHLYNCPVCKKKDIKRGRNET